MKINLSQLEPELRLELTGQEPWLEAIYADFPTGEAPEAGRPLITGHLTLTKDEAGTVRVLGRVQYAPRVACGRCELRVPFPLDVRLDTRVLPENLSPDHADNFKRDRNLSASELDTYYVENDEVDVEELVNDAIQTEIPTKYVPVDESGKSCRVCKADLGDDLAFGGGGKPEAAQKPSPFAALKDLKLKN